jgi:hypothetical protein
MPARYASTGERPLVLRACSTCRFYEPSATWRQGWCRNARLYGPQESHPVDAGTLDCENAAAKGLWEPANAQELIPRQRSAVHRAHPNTPAQGLGQGSGRSGGETMADGEGRAGSSEERTVSYQPEERYWTDYLRIALPVIGLLLLIGLLWYWASALIGDGGNQPPPTPETAAVITRINEATPAPPTATAVVIAPTPGPPLAPTATAAPAVATTQAVTPTPAAAAADAANPCASLPVYPVGAMVQTTAELNLREGPSTDSAPVVVLPEGTRLQVTGEFQEAGQCDWWPVTVVDTGQAGFVIEQYLKPTPA